MLKTSTFDKSILMVKVI